VVGSDVLVLPSGAEIKFPNTNIVEAFKSSPEEIEARICAALNVPPIVAGFKVGLDRSTYSNYEEARRSFYSETIDPLLTRLSGVLTKGLGEDIELVIPDKNTENEDKNETPRLDPTAKRSGAV
jgi:phage portal protein BeeE